MGLLTVAEVAKRLGISAYTVREMIARRELPAIHVGRPAAKRRTLRVISDDVDCFLRSRKGESEAEPKQRRMSAERQALRELARQA